MDDGAKKVRCTVQSETSTTWCEVSSGEMPLRLNRRSHSRFSGCHYLSRETWGNIRFLPFGVVRVNETCLGFGWCLMPAYPATRAFRSTLLSPLPLALTLPGEVCLLRTIRLLYHSLPERGDALKLLRVALLRGARCLLCAVRCGMSFGGQHCYQGNTTTQPYVLLALPNGPIPVASS